MQPMPVTRCIIAVLRDRWRDNESTTFAGIAEHYYGTRDTGGISHLLDRTSRPKDIDRLVSAVATAAGVSAGAIWRDAVDLAEAQDVEEVLHADDKAWAKQMQERQAQGGRRRANG
ncbi:MAG: hypothetical protein ACREXY_01300 [Gammaproteobacteria bacterium]